MSRQNMFEEKNIHPMLIREFRRPLTTAIFYMRQKGTASVALLIWLQRGERSLETSGILKCCPRYQNYRSFIDK